MSTTAEEALSRAKAIAARLSGTPDEPASQPSMASPNSSSSGGGTSGTKRKRWGVAPAIVAAAQEALPGLTELAKKAKLGKETSNKRIWVPTSAERPESHFKAFLMDRLVEIEEEIGASRKEDSVKLTVELKGRGSSNSPPPPGIPEEPMHVWMTGSDEALTLAEPKVEALLSDAENAPVEASAIEEAASSPSNNALALTTIGHGSSSSSYRPATVAQLISNNPINNLSGENLMEEKIEVPNGVVGYLIGRGGETISSMQARSGCKIQIQKEHELQPGQTHRVIILQAATQESIDQCRGMVESMVQDRIRAAGGVVSGSKDVKVNDALLAGHALLKVEVPDADVGLIIGKMGATIKTIQETTGAQIQIPPSGNPDNPSIRTVSITHPNEAGANMAKKQIEELLSSKPSYAQQKGGPQITVQVMIPDRDVGLCIGRQGCVIREMQHKTGTRIQIPSQPTPGQAHRIATVSGTQDGCNQVQALIERIITEQSSACVMSGTPYNQNQFYQQNYSENGAHANSAEWQAYYAAQAVAKQQQPQAQTSPVAVAAAPAADAYYEQFFRYAYYYGEDAARQYYGAWSPPLGTPNPYGINPNGVTPAPAASPVAAAGPSMAVTQAAPAVAAGPPRDSSVRKVSNLPAWMTRS